MKLFVDDERPAPQGWQLALTSAEAIAALKTGEVTVMSLDHDLGTQPDGSDDTTRNVVNWICGTWGLEGVSYWPESVYVHSGNPVGEEWLVGTIRRFAPTGTLKGYGLNYWGTGPDSVIRNP